MTQHDYTYNPNEIFTQLCEAGDTWAEAQALSDQMENMKKVHLAIIAEELIKGGKSKTAAFDLAPADPRYITHIDGVRAAKENAIKASTRYNNLRALADARRTQESSVRAQTNPGGR